MLFAILILFLTLCIIANRRQGKKARLRTESARINMLLQNVEAYDGSDKGQKRLEDNK